MSEASQNLLLARKLDISQMKSNPQILLSLIDQYVKIDLIKNVSYTGFIHSIDPVTCSIIISIPHEDAFQTILIPGLAVLEITKTTPDMNIIPPSRKPLHTYSNDDILARKQKVMTWFKANLLTVTEDGDNINFGNVKLLPPYDITDISTDNPIVALQVRRTLENLPDNFEPNVVLVTNSSTPYPPMGVVKGVSGIFPENEQQHSSAYNTHILQSPTGLPSVAITAQLCKL